ncbi:MAG: glycerol-3-phosphate acyltransferase [Candidatus Syntrophosphaera sp.]|nr:glycerol-3-phosphate acyltransferase [Candidatus Syntrophosphaera sp.]
MMYLIMFLTVVVAYCYGCFSTARLLAKTARSLNIYKIGTGLADTENIYANVSKPLGILVGALDILKALLFLLVVEYGLRALFPTGEFSLLHDKSVMLVYGLAMLIGHCLPAVHRFRGGRGIFTYTGFLLYFAPGPMLVALIVAWLIVLIWKQIRFAQYVIVILPVLLTHVFYTFIPLFRKELPPYFVAIIWGIAILMGALNFIVSKKMGEL